jgi:hypothetical protein
MGEEPQIARTAHAQTNLVSIVILQKLTCWKSTNKTSFIITIDNDSILRLCPATQAHIDAKSFAATELL